MDRAFSGLLYPDGGLLFLFVVPSLLGSEFHIETISGSVRLYDYSTSLRLVHRDEQGASH